MLGISLPVIKRVVLSAYKREWRIFDCLGRSLMYRMNNIGPNIEPCGTPHVICRMLLLNPKRWLLMFHVCFVNRRVIEYFRGCCMLSGMMFTKTKLCRCENIVIG